MSSFRPPPLQRALHFVVRIVTKRGSSEIVYLRDPQFRVAKGRGDIEGLLIQLFNEAIHAKNIIIFLDEAHLFLKDGTGSVDLANIILPVLEGGAKWLDLLCGDVVVAEV